MLVERYLDAGDYAAALAWQLCAWCCDLGAQDFALDFLGTAPLGAEAYAQLEAPLRPFSRPPATRERLVARPGKPFARETKLWALTPESLRVLPGVLPRGPFEYPFGAPAWAEDLTLYRDGNLLLGIISHEDMGILRVTELEASRLAVAGFPSRMRGAARPFGEAAG